MPEEGGDVGEVAGLVVSDRAGLPKYSLVLL